MANGIKALRKLQFGRESASGTAVAASTIWRGMGTIQDEHKTVFVEEDVGYLSGTDRTYVPKLGTVLTLEDTPATFEQLPHILEMAIRTDPPAQDGAGTGYIYQYTPPTTALNTLKTYTIEGGDNNQAEEIEYVFAESFTLSGTAGEAVMMGAALRGRQVTKTSFTGALSLPTVEEIMTSKCKLYIDAAGGTIGSTQVANTLISFSLTYNTGWIPKYTADGALYYSFIQSTMPELVCELTFEHNASAVTEKDAWIAQTARLMRLEFEGSALGTAGTAYTYKTLTIDMAGKYESFDAISDQDGNDIITATFRARYNGTAALFADVIVVNELTTLP